MRWFWKWLERVLWRHEIRTLAKKKGESIEEFFAECDKQGNGELAREIGRDCGLLK